MITIKNIQGEIVEVLTIAEYLQREAEELAALMAMSLTDSVK